MCGIAGFFNTAIEVGRVQTALNLLKHRGPDAQQYVIKKSAGLLHTRLSIIELSPLGSQPYVFENLTLVFNGEIYNYKEIRDELEKKGYSFISNSDTEVLIKAFHCWDEKCLDHFIGMFAFAIYDELKDEIFVARDRVGVKPLYYSYNNGAYYFASELKALAAFKVPKEIDLNAVTLYFRFGFIPQHHTVYSSVSKLEPAHYIRVTKSGLVKKKYWSIQNQVVPIRNESEWLESLEAILISAFRYRMVSDVPVGVFLSGGIDSSLLTAILQKHYGNIHTFTIGFDEAGFDESVYARQVAEHLKTHHIEKTLKLSDARELFSQFYSIYDEPFADTSGIPTACVTQLARENGMKVVLSADGGDELFGGYSHYMKAYNLFKRFNKLPYRLRTILAKSSRLSFSSTLRRRIGNFNFEHKLYAFEELVEQNNPVSFFESYVANQSLAEIENMLPQASYESLQPENNAMSPVENMMSWDFRNYLPDDLLVKVDRATMFHSTECRDPFLDHRLVELAAQIPESLKIKNGMGKYLLRRLLAKYVPEHLYERRKQGFSIPIFAWFSKDLDEMFEQYFSKSSLSQIPFFNHQEIQEEYQKYRKYKAANKQYNIEKMWRILSFMLWWEKYMKHET